MKAILLTEENMDKIREEGDLDPATLRLAEKLTRKHHKWYVVRGYYSKLFPEPKSSLIPACLIHSSLFESDVEKMKTDWDQIVRVVR